MAASRAMQRVQHAMDFFSVPLLLRTLFDPFRQIGTDISYGRSLDAQLRAWGDRVFSRLVGAVVRTAVIFFGVSTALLLLIVGFVTVIVWPLLPLAPIIGALLTIGLGG